MVKASRPGAFRIFFSSLVDVSAAPFPFGKFFEQPAVGRDMIPAGPPIGCNV